MMLKLKLQYFGQLMRRVDSLERTLMLGGIGGRRRRRRQRMRWLDGITRWTQWTWVWVNWHESEWTPGVGDGQGGLACCDSWDRKESDMTEQLNWLMDCNPPGFLVHHQLPQSTQTHVYWVDDAIQPSCPLWSPSPPALNLSQHQRLFQWVRSLHQVAKLLEFQLQHQSFQWIFRIDFL